MRSSVHLSRRYSLRRRRGRRFLFHYPNRSISRLKLRASRALACSSLTHLTARRSIESYRSADDSPAHCVRTRERPTLEAANAWSERDPGRNEFVRSEHGRSFRVLAHNGFDCSPARSVADNELSPITTPRASPRARRCAVEGVSLPAAARRLVAESIQNLTTTKSTLKNAMYDSRNVYLRRATWL